MEWYSYFIILFLIGGVWAGTFFGITGNSYSIAKSDANYEYAQKTMNAGYISASIVTALFIFVLYKGIKIYNKNKDNRPY